MNRASRTAPSQDMLSGLILEDAILHNAAKKISNPIDKTYFLGILAGIWIGFGGTAALTIAGGIPREIREEWPVLPRLGFAIFFPFALHFILMFGGELFTGNCMILSVGVLNRVTPVHLVLLNLFLVYLGNWTGCLISAYFFGYLTDLFVAEPHLSFVRELTLSKTVEHGWGVYFLRAIPANALVNMAVMLGLAARDSAGKIMALYFPIILFVIGGFEHCVANMFFLPIGLMYGAPTTIGRLWFNQSAALLGNFIGGAIVIGASEHIMNHWVSFLPDRLGGGYLLEEGTLAAHDIESTRRAQDFSSHEEAAKGKMEMRRRLSISRSQSRTVSRQGTKINEADFSSGSSAV